tara:strand:- start:53 stop:1264 length:1212 start_codon:yes stop_codon:yes gene_type:complete
LKNNLADFDYLLPEEVVAKFPAEPRDSSKLICYKQGAISHHKFTDLTSLLPKDSLLVFNDTKVIPARLIFHRATGGRVEVFMVEPNQPTNIVQDAMQVTGECVWKCVVGNLKRWRDGEVLWKQFKVNGEKINLRLQLENREDKTVRFKWEPAHISAASWIEALGQVPLPPYLMREVVSKDKEDYQTIYAQHQGAVAAPTAGLHFTENTWAALDNAGIKRTFLTLHVGAGTFLPVFEEDIKKHPMHVEQLFFNKTKVEEILNHKGSIVPVGTTSLRCLESLYWFGVQLINDPKTSRFFIDQDLPYKAADYLPSKTESMHAVLNFMNSNEIENIHGETGIFIYPGYTFKMCDALITNFHRPMSTLVMLIAAFMGNSWRELYDEALRNDYRFLSYGDSSIIFPNKL